MISFVVQEAALAPPSSRSPPHEVYTNRLNPENKKNRGIRNVPLPANDDRSPISICDATILTNGDETKNSLAAAAAFVRSRAAAAAAAATAASIDSAASVTARRRHRRRRLFSRLQFRRETNGTRASPHA